MTAGTRKNNFTVTVRSRLKMATSTTAGGRLEFNSVTVSSNSNPEKGTTVVGLKTNDTATENEVGQIHGVRNMMEGGIGILKMVTESTKTTRKTIMEVGSRENHKVKAWRLGKREGPMTVIGKKDWSTAMGLVHGPTDENTRETGKTGTSLDTENTVSAAT